MEDNFEKFLNWFMPTVVIVLPILVGFILANI